MCAITTIFNRHFNKKRQKQSKTFIIIVKLRRQCIFGHMTFETLKNCRLQSNFLILNRTPCPKTLNNSPISTLEKISRVRSRGIFKLKTHCHYMIRRGNTICSAPAQTPRLHPPIEVIYGGCFLYLQQNLITQKYRHTFITYGENRINI